MAITRDELVDRLRALVQHYELHLSTNRSALAEKLGFKQRSTITNAINRRYVSSGLQLRFQEKLGVERRYWTSPKRLAPEDCIRDPKEILGEGHSFVLRRLQQLAKQRGEPPAVAGNLAYLDPPKDADVWWWLDKYFEIVDAEHARHSKKKGTSDG